MSPTPPDTLVAARQDAGLSQEQLWLRYFALGGMSRPLELEAVVHDALHTSAHDRNVVVHALNERFTELGRNHPIPYSKGPKGTSQPTAEDSAVDSYHLAGRAAATSAALRALVAGSARL